MEREEKRESSETGGRGGKKERKQGGSEREGKERGEEPYALYWCISYEHSNTHLIPCTTDSVSFVLLKFKKVIIHT